MFCEKGVLRNFTKITGKHLCQSLFFNKIAGLRPVFSCEFCEISKNTLFHRTPLVAASRPKLKDFEEKYDVQVLLKEKVSLHKK